jgi:hypothetical protein
MDTITSKDGTATPRVIDNPVVLAAPTPSDGDLFCKPNPEIIFAKGEFHMTAESFEGDPESDLAYWKCRVSKSGNSRVRTAGEERTTKKRTSDVSLSALWL